MTKHLHWSFRSRVGSAPSERGQRSRTLEAAFDPRNNSLNALRLVFATAVIVSHAWPIGGFGPDPALGGVTVGGWAVGGFFVISGYLITGSRFRSSLGSYLWRRFLRIFPGLWACLLVTVVVFVSAASFHEGGGIASHLGARASYVLTKGLLVPGHAGIAGTLGNVPHPTAWNGSLWTLPVEFACYIAVAILLSIAVLRRRPATLAVAFVSFAALHLVDVEISPLPGASIRDAIDLVAFFLAGALLYAYRERIPLRGSLAAFAMAVLVLASAVGHASSVAALPLAYICLWLGVVLPLRRVGRTNDISYGVYIYAFPVGQLLALFGAQAVGIGGFVFLSVVLTFPFAAASWFIVERPAMRLKNKGPSIRRALSPRTAWLAVRPGTADEDD